MRMVSGMAHARSVTKDSNGNLIAPKWLAAVVPLLCAGASWAASYGAVGARLTSVEERLRQTPTLAEIQTIRDLLADFRAQFISYSADGRQSMVKIAAIEAILSEMRRPR